MTDPITAEALYPRWAHFIEPDDIVIAETGTCSMGLASTQLPPKARFYNKSCGGPSEGRPPPPSEPPWRAPGRRVVFITGEGSHQLTAQEIGQFHRLGLRPVMFVLKNSGYLIERLAVQGPDDRLQRRRTMEICRAPPRPEARRPVHSPASPRWVNSTPRSPPPPPENAPPTSKSSRPLRSAIAVQETLRERRLPFTATNYLAPAAHRSGRTPG
jgi:hypothetical protein